MELTQKAAGSIDSTARIVQYYSYMDFIMMDLEEGWNYLERWITQDRLGRRRYLQINVLAGVIGFALILLPFLFILFLPDFNSDFLMVPVAAVGIAVAIVMILIYIASSIARLRDMGRSTNWFIAGLIPYVNVLFFLFLALTEGKLAKARVRRPKKEEEATAPEESPAS